MAHVLVLIQGLVALICFFAPGQAILSRLTAAGNGSWPLAFKLSASFALSSALVVASQLVFLTFLAPTLARYAAWVTLLLSAAYLVARGLRQWRDDLSRLDRRELIVVCILSGCLIFWLLAVPLSPYPSHLTIGLGDMPVYFSAASDLVNGRGWLPGYFVGDYPGGVPAYVTLQPALALITSFFFQVVGVNPYSLYVYGIVAGLLLVYVAATFACGPTLSSAAQGRRLLPLTLVFLLLPVYFLFSSLGAHTLPGALLFLIATSFATSQFAPKRVRAVVVAVAVVLMVVLRPESAFVATLFVLCLSVSTFFRSLRGLAPLHPLPILVAAVGVIAVIVTWFMLPDLLRSMPPTIKGFSVYTHGFDSTTDSFKPLYHPWWKVNERIAQVNFSANSGTESLENRGLGREIQEHPWAFLRFMVNGYGLSADTLAGTFWPGPVINSGLAVAAVVTAVLLVIGVRTRLWWLVGVVLLFLFLGPLLNQAPSPRHLMMVSPVFASLALRSAVQPLSSRLFTVSVRNRHRIAAVLIACCLVLFVANSWLALQARLNVGNNTYRSILRDIDRLTVPKDIVASSYPQLIYFATGRQSVGSTRLMENIDLIIAKFQPDFILVDKARPDAPDDYAMMKREGKDINGYSLALDNTIEGYMLFRRVTNP